MVGVDIPVSAIQAFEPRRALGPSGYTFAVNQVSVNDKDFIYVHYQLLLLFRAQNAT